MPPCCLYPFPYWCPVRDENHRDVAGVVVSAVVAAAAADVSAVAASAVDVDVVDDDAVVGE